MLTTNDIAPFAVRNAQDGSETKLAMQELRLTGTILPVGASLQVRHVFKSAEKNPVEMLYTFALPRDATLRRFRVMGDGFSVCSELKPVAEAEKAYEEGIQRGNLATLAKHHSDGLVTLSLGNIRPSEIVVVTLELLAGAEMRDDGIRLRFPFTLAPTYHRKTRVIEVAPGTGEMELPEEEFGDLILPPWMRDASDLHCVGFELDITFPQPIAEIASPSHAIRVVTERPGVSRVSLGPAHDVPDRDLVLDVRCAQALSGITGGISAKGEGHFAAVIPSTAFGTTPDVPRRVVFVLDRSGSMQGTPIGQARNALEACLAALAKDDWFGLVAFDDQVETFQAALVNGNGNNREKARTFLAGIHARGGTELAAGFLAAAGILAGQGGDIVILTDGQVAGTERILAPARSAGVRLHCLGIGSASQDRFLTLLSRETGGVSRFVTPRERIDMAALDLFASVGRPVAQGAKVSVEGVESVAITPDPASIVFAGLPLVVYGQTGAVSGGRLVCRWDGNGRFEMPFDLASSDHADVVRLLRGARLITDMESRLDTAQAGRAAQRRGTKRTEGALEELSLSYGLSSSRMALVAVVKRKGDRPSELPETRVIPVGMPQDTRFESYFGGHLAMLCASRAPRIALSCVLEEDDVAYAMEKPAVGALGRLVRLVRGRRKEPLPTATDVLIELAQRIEPDGGMPGPNDEERIATSMLALLCFLGDGHTAANGAFRAHVARLIAFLKQSLPGSGGLVVEVIRHVEQGNPLPGDWVGFAAEFLARGRTDPRVLREKLARALQPG